MKKETGSKVLSRVEKNKNKKKINHSNWIIQMVCAEFLKWCFRQIISFFSDGEP